MTTIEIRIDWDTLEGVQIDGIERKLLIRDVPEHFYPRICDYMVENSYKKNVIYQHLKFHEDPELEQDYLRLMNHILCNECSLMVIDEEKDEIFAVALVKWMTEEWRSWINWLFILRSGKLADFLGLQYNCMVDYQKAHPDRAVDSLHLFECHVYNELKENEIFMQKFFNAVCETARHMSMPRVTFMATKLEEQNICKAVGFTELSRTIYSFLKGENGRQYHSLRTIGQTGMILYEYCVEPLTPYFDMLPVFPTDEEDRKNYLKLLELELEKQKKKEESRKSK